MQENTENVCSLDCEEEYLANNHVVSKRSAATNFRSICGSERGPPECNTQRFPAGAPHVGQATDDNCFGVRSFVFMQTDCDYTGRKAVPF